MVFIFKENSVILINKQGNPIGTRIIGPLPKNFKKEKLSKIY
jgi:ribosomal protein L14